MASDANRRSVSFVLIKATVHLSFGNFLLLVPPSKLFRTWLIVGIVPKRSLDRSSPRHSSHQAAPSTWSVRGVVAASLLLLDHSLYE
jgi:hypothetical protein